MRLASPNSNSAGLEKTRVLPGRFSTRGLRERLRNSDRSWLAVRVTGSEKALRSVLIRSTNVPIARGSMVGSSTSRPMSGVNFLRRESQFTSEAFTGVLKDQGINISMDGKGRWVDNVFVERLWRSVKYEDVYLHAYETPTELRAGLARYFEFYNARRRHSALDRRTPDAVYFGQAAPELAA